MICRISPSPKPAGTPGHRDFVSALATGLDIIRAFDHNHPHMTLSEGAVKNGINRAKARRVLLTLHGNYGNTLELLREFEAIGHELIIARPLVRVNQASITPMDRVMLGSLSGEGYR